MTLLSRYLIRQNLFLLFAILLMSTGLYLLTDFFERLDNFLESGTSAKMVLIFFSVKIPLIISQILPAVFMLAMVAQMNFLQRSRELIALTAGGISPMALVRFVFLYGVVWAVAQFTFAQVLGVTGERYAGLIWQEQVRGNIFEQSSIKGIWFTEKNHIVHIGVAYPIQQRGTDILIYSLDDTGIGISEIIKAESFTLADNGKGWALEKGARLVPSTYSLAPFERLEVPLAQDLRAFQVGGAGGVKPTSLSLLELDEAIKRLELAGSNVESLRTAWHGKLAYACSMIVMGLLALLISRLTASIYKAVVLCILIVFFYYGVNTLCNSMGEKGLLSPVISAWFANAFFFCTGVVSLSWPALKSKLRN